MPSNYFPHQSVYKVSVFKNLKAKRFSELDREANCNKPTGNWLFWFRICLVSMSWKLWHNRAFKASVDIRLIAQYIISLNHSWGQSGYVSLLKFGWGIFENLPSGPPDLPRYALRWQDIFWWPSNWVSSIEREREREEIESECEIVSVCQAGSSDWRLCHDKAIFLATVFSRRERILNVTLSTGARGPFCFILRQFIKDVVWRNVGGWGGGRCLVRWNLGQHLKRRTQSLILPLAIFYLKAAFSFGLFIMLI